MLTAQSPPSGTGLSLSIRKRDLALKKRALRQPAMRWLLLQRLLCQGNISCELQQDSEQVLEVFPTCNINMVQAKGRDRTKGKKRGEKKERNKQQKKNKQTRAIEEAPSELFVRPNQAYMFSSRRKKPLAEFPPHQILHLCLVSKHFHFESHRLLVYFYFKGLNNLKKK